MKLHASGEDYLGTILVLQKKLGMVRSVDVARHMEVSKPSVCNAVATLRDGGFLTMDEDHFLHLTDVGREVAEEAYTNYAQRESDRYGDRPHGFDNDKRDKSVYQKFSFGRIEDSGDCRQLPEVKRMLEPLKFFGEKFQDKVYNEINGNEEKERQLKAFQEIFAIRNLIAHQTFVEFTSNRIRGKSFSDIEQMHEDALEFVRYLKTKFS